MKKKNTFSNKKGIKLIRIKNLDIIDYKFFCPTFTVLVEKT